MKVLTELVQSEKPTSVALGYFDGVHRGHAAVIGEAVQCAKENGYVPTVFTLMQSPRTILRGEKSKNIITLDEKLGILESMGVELVYLMDFAGIKDITAEEFVRDIIYGCFNARHAACGFNYHFGAGAKGHGFELGEMCGKYGISVFAKHRITMSGSPISSTRIRECIVNGDIPSANEMLGRLYGFRLPVIHGRQLGRTLGTPTINQEFPEGLVMPLFGVYATSVNVDGKEYCGVTDIGVKPTVGSDRVLIETWMPDYSGEELYGKTIDIRLIENIRAEKKFANINELKDEIIINGRQAKDIFDMYKKSVQTS